MEKYIRRDLRSELEEHLEKDEISLIVGSRQVGKTTLMEKMREKLEEEGKNTLFLNMDIQSDREHLKTQNSLLKKLELEFGDKKGYVFIDEIQRKENAGLFLKGIYDSSTENKLVVSGSGSLELKEKIHESLAGRKRMFELSPITLKEFIDFKTDYKYTDRIGKYMETEKQKFREHLDAYMNFGGYPQTVTSNTEKEKRRTIEEIHSSYLERDVKNFLRVKKIDAFSDLITLLSDQIGGLISYSKLSQNLGIKTSTVRKYIRYLEKTYIITKVRPFFTNKKKEIVKAPVAYFKDLGMRNFSVGRFGSLKLPSEKGKVFENLVHNILERKTLHKGTEIKYWRTKTGSEIDLILDRGNEQIPVEIKHKTDPGITRAMRSFIDSYRPEKALIINIEKEETQEINGTEIKHVPVHRLLTETIEKYY